MLEQIQKFREYLDYIEHHYNNVQKAWALINEKCKDNNFRFMENKSLWLMIDDDVKKHDLSKLSAAEFTQYRQYFFSIEGEVKDKDTFKRAWEHHKTNNIHHWENWTKKEYDALQGEAYLVMMLVDWIAMGFEFGNTARSHYEKNQDKIPLPKWSIPLMYDIFDCVY